MDNENQGIDEYIAKVNSIPKEINSQLFIKEIEDELMERLRKKIAV